MTKTLLTLSADVLDTILGLLPVPDLLHVATCGRAARDIVCAYMHRVYHIQRILSRFFNDVDSFRREMALSGTIISGSQALQLFSHKYWKESNLDLYVPRDKVNHISDVIKREGYDELPNNRKPVLINSSYHTYMCIDGGA
jgi:hypothetical protein